MHDAGDMRRPAADEAGDAIVLPMTTTIRMLVVLMSFFLGKQTMAKLLSVRQAARVQPQPREMDVLTAMQAPIRTLRRESER